MRMPRKHVSYARDQRERAKREKRYLVTVAVEKCVTVQRLADRKLAKRIANFALKVLNA